MLLDHARELERELSEAKAGRDILSEEVNRLIDAAKQSAPRQEALTQSDGSTESLAAFAVRVLERHAFGIAPDGSPERRLFEELRKSMNQGEGSK